MPNPNTRGTGARVRVLIGRETLVLPSDDLGSTSGSYPRCQGERLDNIGLSVRWLEGRIQSRLPTRDVGPDAIAVRIFLNPFEGSPRRDPLEDVVEQIEALSTLPSGPGRLLYDERLGFHALGTPQRISHYVLLDPAYRGGDGRAPLLTNIPDSSVGHRVGRFSYRNRLIVMYDFEAKALAEWPQIHQGIVAYLDAVDQSP